jgi:lysophospholipase L1-like esterase
MPVISYRDLLKFFLVILILSSCAPGNDEDEPKSVTNIKFLALGDSYTAGAGIDTNGSWPNQLVQRLKASGFEFDTSAVIAKTDQTTSDLLRAVEKADLIDFNLVSLQIGVNNQFLGRPFQLFETEFNALLDTAIEITGSSNQVFVLSIPDYGVTPFGAENSATIAEEIDTYNAYIQEQCEERGILFIDVTTLSRGLGDGTLALATDMLHPSAYQYYVWVQEMLPGVINLLQGFTGNSQ